ncbi:MAG TPA: AraC family transcriptional regulator [Bordetella sp.]
MPPHAADTPQPSHAPRIVTLKTPLFTLMRATGQAHGGLVDVPQDDAHAIIIQLQDFVSHRLWQAGRLVYSGGHRQRTLAVTDLNDRYTCQHLSPYDNIRAVLSRSQLEALSEEIMDKRLGQLRHVQQSSDPVAHNLVQALLPALHQPAQADAMFVEHVMLALASHVMRHYGHDDEAPAATTMQPWQERRAKEYMASRLTQEVTLEDVAQACSMSRSHFARTFKKSTGMAPFEWMRHERIKRAKHMLRNSDAALICIAVECGFTDQSHFTRVFTKLTGMSPRAWRDALRH